MYESCDNTRTELHFYVYVILVSIPIPRNLSFVFENCISKFHEHNRFIQIVYNQLKLASPRWRSWYFF